MGKGSCLSWDVFWAGFTREQEEGRDAGCWLGSQLAVPRQGCPAQQPGLLAALPGLRKLALSWMLSEHLGKVGAVCCPRGLYIAGPGPGVCGRRQHGLTVRARCCSQAACPALSPPPASLLGLVQFPLLPSPGGRRGGVAVLGVSLCKHQQSPRAALPRDSTSHVRAAANPAC